MASKKASNKTREAGSASQPDLFFKLITREDAVQVGIQPTETEIQFSTRADLVLVVPPGVVLENTLFDFFRATNVLEFKGEADPFTLREFIRNSLRTEWLFLQSTDPNFDRFLNVIISSRLPRRFLQQVQKRGITFKQTPGRPWLWRGAVGFQDVAIVVCRDLPLEDIYYDWLIFAPADNPKWRSVVAKLISEGNQRLLQTVQTLRPKEFNMLTKSLEEMVNEAIADGFITPEEGERALGKGEKIEPSLEETTVGGLLSIDEDYPHLLPKVLGALTPEARLAGMTAEDRLTGLTAEELSGGLEKLSDTEKAKLLQLLEAQVGKPGQKKKKSSQK